MKSPYAGMAEESWLEVTRKLLANHPLKPTVLRGAVISTWDTLWSTTIGKGPTAVKLDSLRVPAPVVGYFFEVLLTRELERREPKLWRGNRSKEEKDLVCITDPLLSIEIKTSGQAGFRVYGNRSYGQKTENESLVKKEKSGYYITVNFFEQSLTLIRFGWIDAEDWDPQQAPTGQMAGLGKSVYAGKLIPIPGAYRRRSPVLLLEGVGQATKSLFAEHGINTVGDLLDFRGALPSRLEAIRTANQVFLNQCSDTDSI